MKANKNDQCWVTQQNTKSVSGSVNRNSLVGFVPAGLDGFASTHIYL